MKPKSFNLLKPKRELTPSAKTKRRQKAGLPSSHKVVNASLANLRRGGRELDVKVAPVPSESTAAQYVKLRAAGLPAIDAVQFFTGSTRFPKKQLAEIAADWDTHRLVSAAWEVWNGAQWQDMDKDARLTLARDHHLAQAAYFLYTTDYTDANAPLGKIRDAREAIEKYLTTSGGDGEFKAMMKAVLERVDDDDAIGPPKLRLKSVEMAQVETKPRERPH